MREVFVRQLVQVRGVSGEKAAALVDRYSTPARWAPPEPFRGLLLLFSLHGLQLNQGFVGESGPVRAVQTRRQADSAEPQELMEVGWC